MTANQEDAFEVLVWQWINAIPTGCVATYGQIAVLCGMPRRARMVGRVLAKLPPDTRLPWHRVINSQGRISNPNPARQLERLAAEGTLVINGRVRLATYQWTP
jgi:methylated-DNA-protein-cysteine methyltransferase-like protein